MCLHSTANELLNAISGYGAEIHFLRYSPDTTERLKLRCSHTDLVTSLHFSKGSKNEDILISTSKDRSVKVTSRDSKLLRLKIWRVVLEMHEEKAVSE